MASETKIVTPDEHQLKSVATVIREEMLHNWDADDIGLGIRRVRVNEIGDVLEVYLSPGIYAWLCHQKYGNRKRKPFQLNGIYIKQWNP